MYMRLSLAILILFFTDATRAQECPSRHRPTIYSIRREEDLQQIFLSRETLLYLGDRASCGVLKIETTDRAVFYELRVTDDYVGTIPDHGCRRHFYCIAHGGRLIYSPECQDLVKPRK
ncbi:hypothetical protein MTO96_043909 [Rhipicephalus appendiculatus]